MKVVKQIKRIHLDRVEVGLLVGLVFLLSGMMFALGVLVGFGIGEKVATPGQHVALSHESAEVLHGEKDAHRGPASEHQDAAENAGSKIRQAFRESKQQALESIESGASVSKPQPTSVADAEAYFKMGEEKPARAPAAAEQKVEIKNVPEKAAAKPALKQLFERNPATAEAYQPMPGLFTVQIASYSTEDEASAKVRNLREAGFMDAFVIPIKTSGGDKWYRVAVGSHKDKNWAKKTGDKLIRRRLASDFIIRKVD